MKKEALCWPLDLGIYSLFLASSSYSASEAVNKSATAYCQWLQRQLTQSRGQQKYLLSTQREASLSPALQFRLPLHGRYVLPFLQPPGSSILLIL